MVLQDVQHITAEFKITQRPKQMAEYIASSFLIHVHVSPPMISDVY
jgi:hypothetical protein